MGNNPKGESGKRKPRALSLLLLLIVVLTAACFAAFGEEAEGYTDIVLLSTTDMHGKCWHTDLLTNAPVKNSMLSISSAARDYREKYGREHVIMIDNGDLFQGTAVSEVQLLSSAAGESQEPPAMALCLKEIGYDAFVLGNHEFNFNPNVMSSAFQYLRDNGVNVLSANTVWDGTDGVHEAGENAFTPSMVRTIEVEGHEHKIGILGLENCDITRWDLPEQYPGLMFVHPGNDGYSMALEAAPYVTKLREEGCEFVIVSYHGGLGEAERPLVFGDNSESQGLRLIQESEGINLLILGHDHSSAYSNTRYPDKAGNEVLVVNGGSQQMTETVIRFREDDSGALTWEIEDTRNLDLSEYDPDPSLEQKIAPYAALAEEAVSRPLGIAGGEWDQSSDFFLRQTNTVDLINAASMTVPSERLQALYGDPASAGVEGLDHLDVDLSMTSNAITGSYVIRPGDLSMRDIYRLYRFANSLLVIPMRGSEIRAIMEENAANRLTARVLAGKAYLYSKDDTNTHILFGGANFIYDLSAPEGERVRIDGFANGRPFEENRVYLVSVNNYLLGNARCGLRIFSGDDAIWAQEEGEKLQDLIAEYIREQCEANGALTTAPFTWHWSIEYEADPAALPPYEGEAAATLAPAPEDGHTYVLLQESEQVTLSGHPAENGLGAVPCSARGEILAAPLDPEAQRFTVRLQEDGSMALVNADGLFLTGVVNGGVSLTPEMAEDGLSLWMLREVSGGWNIICAGTDGTGFTPQALEFYYGHITAYRVYPDGSYVFNFYEIQEK